MKTALFVAVGLTLVLGASPSPGGEPAGEMPGLDIGLGPAVPGGEGEAGPRPPACLQDEPGPGPTVRAAWRAAGLEAGADRSRTRRVRAAGWLPKVSGGVSGDRGDRWDHRLEPGEARVDQLHRDDGLGWDAGLTWDLSRIAFQSEEVQVAREAARRARERMDLAAEIVRLYFLRHRLLRDGLPPAGSDRALQLAEATATLDAWTGHAFTRRWCRPSSVATTRAAPVSTGPVDGREGSWP